MTAFIVQDYALDLMYDHLYRGLPFSHNLQILAFLAADSDNVKRAEDAFHLPVTGTVDGLISNFARVHLTAASETKPKSQDDLITKALNDCRVDILDTVPKLSFDLNVQPSILGYAGLDGKTEFYLYLAQGGSTTSIFNIKSLWVWA